MEYSHLITLATLLGAHVGRSDLTVAKWCGVHARLAAALRRFEDSPESDFFGIAVLFVLLVLILCIGGR